MPTGVPSEAAAAPRGCQGSRAQSGELADVTDRSMPVIKMGLSRAGHRPGIRCGACSRTPSGVDPGTQLRAAAAGIPQSRSVALRSSSSSS